MGEKLIIVHADNVVGRVHPPAFARAWRAIETLVTAAEKAKKISVRIDTEDQQIPQGADIYFIGDDVSANIAEKVIMPGDNIKIAGIYRDVCVAGVAEISLAKGAVPEIIEEATVIMDPKKWGS